MRPPSRTHLDGRPPDLAAMMITAHRLKGRLARGRPDGGDVSGDGELPRPRARANHITLSGNGPLTKLPLDLSTTIDLPRANPVAGACTMHPLRHPPKKNG